MIALFALLVALAQAPAPALIDQTGHAFALDALRGRPLIVTFVSAHCTDACPLVNAQFADAARAIASKKLDARLLTITLDPQHDPPSLMRALARRFDADPRYWLVAGGKADGIDVVMRRFGVIAVAGKSGYREEHTTFIYVLDRNGRLVKTMLASTNLTSDVVDAITELQVAKR